MKTHAHSLHAVPVFVLGVLLAILIGLNSSPPAQAESVLSPQASAAPAATYRLYLPLIKVPEKATSRIGAITPLSASVPRYGKFEIAFTVSTNATNFYFPYDPAAPYNERGVTVDLLIKNPGGAEKTVPCFYYQPVDASLTPVGQPDWRCRYSPETIGTWRYRVRLIDAIGQAESTEQTFNVTASANRGFVRVSPTDSHYFAFDDGTPFLTPLINVEWGNPLNNLDLIRANIPRWGQNGVRFVRWFPTGEGGNYYIVPYGDELKMSWGFGPAWTSTAHDPLYDDHFIFEPYYYSGQSIAAVPGARYRLTLRAKVTGDKVFRPQLGSQVKEIRASDWSTHTLEIKQGSETGLMVWLHDGYSEDDNTPGLISVHEVTLQRDETGQGGWGSNLLTRGDPDTYKFIDQVGAARLDEVMRLSEQHGVYHKLTLFHKNDQVLGYLQADGSSTPDWDINNFYSQNGSVPRWLQKAYARYFVARWSYSTALHSLELGNENMLTDESYEAAYSVLSYIKSLAPRRILLSNSFWGYFVVPYWTDARYGPLMDYADKHWYARPAGDGELVSNLYTDSAANVRECQRRFAEYRTEFAQNKPIVRGEAGVWSGDNYDPIDLGNGAATYYHKQLWAQMGDQCAGEWYTDYLDTHNLWGDYLRYEQFLQGEPLTNGRYADVGSDTGALKITATSGAVRAWGKLDASGGRGLLWIDNAQDTWKRVADGQSVTPATAALEISGLANGTYQATWFNTATGTTSTTTHSVANGKLTLNVSALAHDVAVKIKKQ
ncbi:hypothetical protein TFLX_02060 [Thermoflexales bacterium]|nr:hypothetical protein TFLX_02060 [Thermoflexales bacterium]